MRLLVSEHEHSVNGAHKSWCTASQNPPCVWTDWTSVSRRGQYLVRGLLGMCRRYFVLPLDPRPCLCWGPVSLGVCPAGLLMRAEEVLCAFYLHLRPSHNAAASACPRGVLLFDRFYFQVGLIHLNGCRGLKKKNVLSCGGKFSVSFLFFVVFFAAHRSVHLLNYYFYATLYI